LKSIQNDFREIKMHTNKILRDAAKHGHTVWAKSEIDRDNLMATAKRIGCRPEIRVPKGIVKRIYDEKQQGGYDE